MGIIYNLTIEEQACDFFLEIGYVMENLRLKITVMRLESASTVYFILLIPI